MTIESIEPFIGLIKDIATITFYLVATGGTVFGLRTWKLQLLGGAKLEVSRELIKAIYRIQESIKGLRRNVEFSFSSLSFNHKGDIYREVLDRIDENVVKVKELAFELSIIDKEVNDQHIDILVDISRDFKSSVIQYHDLMKVDISSSIPTDTRRKLLSDLNGIVNCHNNDDEFAKRLDDTVYKIELDIARKIKL